MNLDDQKYYMGSASIKPGAKFLKTLDEAIPLALAHNRPPRTALVTLDRHRSYKGKKWIDEKTVWEKGMDYPVFPGRKR